MSYWDRLKKENRNLREFMRVQAMAMLALADNFGDELCDAIKAGMKISYQIEGVKKQADKVEVAVAPGTVVIGKALDNIQKGQVCTLNPTTGEIGLYREQPPQSDHDEGHV
jgi:hypothetical protein